MRRRGQCLCGAVSFTADTEAQTFGACHCGMCRRWTGGPMMTVTVPNAGQEWDGAEHIRVYASSDWAERGFCSTCGSNLFFRVTKGAWANDHHLPIGLFEETSGLKLTREVFIDAKPDAYALSDGLEQLTAAQLMARINAD